MSLRTVIMASARSKNAPGRSGSGWTPVTWPRWRGWPARCWMSAYKLVTYAGRPVMKLSPGQATALGAKQVYRGPGGDVLALRDEPPGAWRGTPHVLESTTVLVIVRPSRFPG